MSAEDLEKYETEMELQLYREYRDIVRQFTYVVETERRFYLANSVDLQVREAGGEVYFELKLSDAQVTRLAAIARRSGERRTANRNALDSLRQQFRPNGRGSAQQPPAGRPVLPCSLGPVDAVADQRASGQLQERRVDQVQELS